MSWLRYLKILSYFLYAVFKVHIWLIFYQSLELWISSKLWSLVKFLFWSGGHLLSHTVSSAVPSAACVLTIVFGMGTGVSHKRIATRKIIQAFDSFDNSTINNNPYFFPLERRWSSRTFRYGYLVTTSPQLSVPPSAAPSLRLGHWLRALPTPMVWRAVCTRPGNVFTATFWFAITSDSSFM